MPKASTIAENLFSASLQGVELVKEELPRASYLTIMMDMWTASNNESYLGIIATYYVGNEWKSRLISMLPVPTPESHDNVSIRNALHHCLRHCYDSTTGKIFALVGDNANVNVAVGRAMGVHTMGCLSHKMNLVYKDLLESVDNIKQLKDKCSTVVSFFHRSCIVGHAANIGHALKTYSKTRWYSLYDTFKSVLRNKRELQTYFRNNPDVNHYNLEENDFNLIEVLLPLLALLNSAIGDLSTNSSHIGDAVPIYYQTKTKLTEYWTAITEELPHHELAIELCQDILTAYTTRFDFIMTDNMLLAAALIDPVLKSKAVDLSSIITEERKTSAIDYLVLLARDLQQYNVATDSETVVRQELTNYIGLSAQVFSMIVSNDGENQWKNVAKG